MYRVKVLSYGGFSRQSKELAIVGGMVLVYLMVLDVIKVQYYKRADKDASRLLDVHTSAQVKH